MQSLGGLTCWGTVTEAPGLRCGRDRVQGDGGRAEAGEAARERSEGC